MKQSLLLVFLLSTSVLFAEGGPTINNSVPIPAIPLMIVGAVCAVTILKKSKL